MLINKTLSWQTMSVRSTRIWRERWRYAVQWVAQKYRSNVQI